MINMDRIKVLARTSYYPNWPFAAHAETSSELVADVQDILISLSTEENALAQAQIQGFTSPNLKELQELEALVEFE